MPKDLVQCLWVVAICLAMSAGAQATPPRPCRFVIPTGYVGWIRVEFNDPSAPVTPIEAGTLVFRIPDIGVLATSSNASIADAKDEYIQLSHSGPVRRNVGKLGSGGDIWGGIICFKSDGLSYAPPEPDPPDPELIHFEFFVGTQLQFERFGGLHRDARGNAVPGRIDLKTGALQQRPPQRTAPN